MLQSHLSQSLNPASSALHNAQAPPPPSSLPIVTASESSSCSYDSDEDSGPRPPARKKQKRSRQIADSDSEWQPETGDEFRGPICSPAKRVRKLRTNRVRPPNKNNKKNKRNTTKKRNANNNKQTITKTKSKRRNAVNSLNNTNNNNNNTNNNGNTAMAMMSPTSIEMNPIEHDSSTNHEEDDDAKFEELPSTNGSDTTINQKKQKSNKVRGTAKRKPKASTNDTESNTNRKRTNTNTNKRKDSLRLKPMDKYQQMTDYATLKMQIKCGVHLTQKEKTTWNYCTENIISAPGEPFVDKIYGYVHDYVGYYYENGQTSRNVIMCRFCNANVPGMRMNRHIATWHSSSRPYVCAHPGCQKKFKTYAYLKQHKQIHSTVRAYACSVCGKRYKQYATRYRHEQNVHNMHRTQKLRISAGDD